MRKRLLVLGVGGDLVLLGYFKYANFFLDSVNAVAATGLSLGEIVLPLGISFFTFTQIAFLVDTFRGEVREFNFVHYALFVTYFPHLIAGPVLHHKEMMPQFALPSTYRLDAGNIAAGITIFAIGLFKKTVMADGVAQYASPVFSAAADGAAPTFFDAWGGALAYTLQLYYDFSGYSDMAIGLSRLFGIVLPLNFFSPYRAVNIIDFWRRWHMTLSRFLRDYLYYPLGGNRRGGARRYANLMITMLLGGLWHGAGWTYVVWGGLHGLYLVINHGWRALRTALGHDLSRSTWGGRALARTITLLAVIVGWVFFRATDLGAAMAILKGMCGLNGVALPVALMQATGSLEPTLRALGVVAMPGGGTTFVHTWTWVAVLFAIALAAPNTAQIMERVNPALDYEAMKRTVLAETPGASSPSRYLRWRPGPDWAAATAVATAISLLSLNRVSEFLYFQF
jgi:D-alanyl-lipoteichoic acid acyltransferase DltB (MBOAT superfamily)